MTADGCLDVNTSVIPEAGKRAREFHRTNDATPRKREKKKTPMKTTTVKSK